MHNKNLSKGAHAETPQVRHPERDFITGLQKGQPQTNMQPDPLPPFQICLSLTSAEENLKNLQKDLTQKKVRVKSTFTDNHLQSLNIM